MNAQTLQLSLIAAYIIIALAYGLERNWPKMFYFISAAAITVSVIFMD